MTQIENQAYDMERALYGQQDLILKNCAFDGPADGESALKECRNIQAEHCLCKLRYPFWHDHNLRLSQCELTPACRAALWYSEDVTIAGTKLHGIKALRECRNVTISDCDIRSAEFGWSVRDLHMTRSQAESEYFLMRGENLHLCDVQFQGKYSFQYTQNVTIENAKLDTKDAFWHARNVTVKNSVVKGEYLAWYSDGLTLINCTIIGTQPFCYCKNLTLIDCEMLETDLCFEKSQVNATITTDVISIKNPLSGSISLPSVGEVILDDPNAKAAIVLQGAPAAAEPITTH